MISYQTGGDEPFYEQVAVVSGGFGSCGNTEFPGIYVRLEDYQVLRWIYRVAFGRRLAKPAPTGSHTKIHFPTIATTSRPKPETNNNPTSEFPWLVSIRGRLGDDDDNHFCYGSIINQWQLITAAHCIQGALKTHVSTMSLLISIPCNHSVFRLWLEMGYKSGRFLHLKSMKITVLKGRLKMILPWFL